MKRWFLVEPITAGFILSASLLLGHQGDPPFSSRQPEKLALALNDVDVFETPAIHAEKLLEEDAKQQALWPLRYASVFKTRLSPFKQGAWETLPNGDQIWRLRVHAAGATDLNFGFEAFHVPEGVTLHVYSEEDGYYQGPYSAQHNREHGQLWTAVVPGDKAVIELFWPVAAKAVPQLELTHIGRGYRDLFKRNNAGQKAGSCNIDVICSQGDNWRNEIRSVAVYSTGGSRFCTGTMIMNVRRNFRNFFLTASHCGVNDDGVAASLVVYWNFESPTCGQQGGGSLADNQSGAAHLANDAGTDFSLIELDDDPSSSHNVYYAGWDRSGVAPSSAVAIHHPNTDEKSISFCNSALTTDRYLGSDGNYNHWKVSRWNAGTTEPGSSGSGLWDGTSHLLIGQLHGGYASCDEPMAADWYGKFYDSWTVGSDSSGRLRDWLDPDNTTSNKVSGSDPGARLATQTLTAPVLQTKIPTGSVYTVTWTTTGHPTDTRTILEYNKHASGDPAPYYLATAEAGFDGWVVSHGSGSADWTRSTTDPYAGLTCFFAQDVEAISDQRLTSPGLSVSNGAYLAFWHKYHFEMECDGGVVEISTLGSSGPWTDLGSKMIENGYNGVVYNDWGNPLDNERDCFTGENNLYHRTVVDLSSYAGRTVYIRFRVGTDESFGEVGWRVDNIQLRTELAEWKSLGVSTLGSSSHAWTVPMDKGDDYVIRMRHTCPNYRISNWTTGSIFSVVGAGDPLPLTINNRHAVTTLQGAGPNIQFQPPSETQYITPSTQLMASCSSTVSGSSTQYTCTGWTRTGSDPGSGSGAVTPYFALTNNAVLQFHWTTQVWLQVQANQYGSVDVTDGWYDLGSPVLLTATPNPFAQFSGWSGDVAPAQTNVTPLQLTMASARSVYANFTMPTNIISPSSITAPPQGGSGVITVQTDADTVWTFTNDSAWITATNIIAQGSGMTNQTPYYLGTGTIAYTIMANDQCSARSATLYVAKFPISVYQEATAFTLMPQGATATWQGGTGLVQVTAGSACGWPLTIDVPWISIVTNQISGGYQGGLYYGGGNLIYLVSTNDAQARQGVITLNGHDFTIQQDANTGNSKSVAQWLLLLLDKRR